MEYGWDGVTFEWDAVKAESNIAKHGVSFEAIEAFDWQKAVIVEDDRFSYGERRYNAFGDMNGRLYAVVFTIRGQSIRLIGLRKANPREVRRYGKAQT